MANSGVACARTCVHERRYQQGTRQGEYGAWLGPRDAILSTEETNAQLRPPARTHVHVYICTHDFPNLHKKLAAHNMAGETSADKNILLILDPRFCYYYVFFLGLAEISTSSGFPSLLPPLPPAPSIFFLFITSPLIPLALPAPD